MRRRSVLALPFLSLACGDKVRAPLPFTVGGMPPWHMWGTTERLQLDGGNIASRQLVKINYRRPETWSMFFSAKVVSASSGGPSLTLEIDFEVIAGVGRTMFDTGGGFPLATTGRGFAYFNFILPMPYVPSPFGLKYTTTGLGPPMDDAAATSRPVVEWLPAQDIQVQAGARATPSVGSRAIIEVSSWFAPRSHVRPDWWRETMAEQFRGGETDGT